MRTLMHALIRTVRRITVRRIQEDQGNSSTLRERIARDELQFELVKGLV
jgi:hypothetical protein